MVLAGRLFWLAAASASLLAAGAPAPVSAQGRECKSEVITATGRAKFRPFTKSKELDGNGAAMTDAIATWKREVTARFGDDWSKWSEAESTTRDCDLDTDRRFFRRSFVRCTISGRPCVAPVSRESESVAEKGARGTQRYRGSYAYRRAMQRQERWAAARERAEDWGWRREQALQRYLARARDRAEERARRRADARARRWEWEYGD